MTPTQIEKFIKNDTDIIDDRIAELKRLVKPNIHNQSKSKTTETNSSCPAAKASAQKAMPLEDYVTNQSVF